MREWCDDLHFIEIRITHFVSLHYNYLIDKKSWKEMFTISFKSKI